ncbi:orotidine-5'-phosphate decarboxylase [Geothermobacter ehrlichii]|uniref:Orotidine 5'-phosphate decarboxylase n=1 Tax=Geothermobacter ehrlichii TaxID=213224 RepID=A0A5D3WHH5_9BACT|nr:orotidine-5'-phosphate decarboxylase [Geothermobacter ehrlichii]TYO96302.1 orotidine-5'-phosphate decarboxylase [Geothermobacter ehrlichii]
MKENASRHLAFAMDVDSFDEAEKWVKLLRGKVGLFKVGKQLFTRCGPDVVRMIRAEGGEVFLDLKYHDIPNTVAKAAVEACRLGVRMFNVHALGGGEMMRATSTAVREVCEREGIERPVVLAVTILTSSTDETLRQIGIDRPVTEMVPRLAALARDAGLDGVVASPREVGLIRSACGPEFRIVTPGVRPAFAAANDQKRVTTPAEAIRAGADYLVVGRPISAADDPVDAAARILAEIEEALSSSADG